MGLLADLIVCRFIKKNSYSILCLLHILTVSCKNNGIKKIDNALPFYNTAAFDAEWISETDPGYKSIHTIAPFGLLNQAGQKITNDSLAGKIYVANFFFTTCPNICPKMTNNLQALQDSFLNDSKVKLVSFTVMHWVDSVQRLKEYGEIHHILPQKWHLLTGNKTEIYALARTSFFAEKDLGLRKDSTQFLHTESMLLIDTKGRIRGIYNATQKPDIGRIAEDIRLLEQEK